MSNEIIPMSEAVIARQENISTIIKAGPQSFQTNSLSCQRCTEAGQALLDEIKEHGMSDALDQRLAAYIEKARKTVKAMNERRSPVTKLFDQVRTEFTSLENAISPTNKGSIPYQLQQYRNAFATKKREEEERRRAAEQAAAALAQARDGYRAEVKEDYVSAFNNLVTGAINTITDLNASVTLENYDVVAAKLKDMVVTLPADWCPPSSVRLPYNLPPEEAKEIRTVVFRGLLARFEEQYRYEVEAYRDETLDKFPSKKVELERMAQASAAEAARLKAEMAQREAEEAARKERERQEAEAAAKQKADMEKANAEMSGLFGMAKAEQVYTPKTKVSLKLNITNPQAFLGIVSLWWQKEGCTLSIEELSKIFKKQITFCEKIATKDNVLVETPGLEYVEDVKAK